MLSFWEKDSFQNYDVIIVGAGIVGLSTAASLKEKNEKLSILVLEKGVLPTGASTKNAGFACFGSITEVLSDFETTGEIETLKLIKQRFKGLNILRNRLGDENIDFQQNGGYELLDNSNVEKLEQLDRINKLTYPLFDENIYSIENDKIDSFGFNNKHVLALVKNKLEGQIHSGKMMSSLWNYVQSLGVKILTSTEVLDIKDEQNYSEVRCKNISFSAKKVVICTNAFTKTLFPALELNPGRGQVLITKPIENLPFKGVFHVDEGYYYFRNYGKRVLFGGGRNLDFEGETSTEFSLNEKIFNVLESKLREIIIPGFDFEIEHKWAGIMAFGGTKVPILEKVSKNVLLGVRLNGMGVAIGSKLGEELSERIIIEL